MRSNTKADAVSVVNMAISQLAKNVLKIQKKRKKYDNDEEKSEYKRGSFAGQCVHCGKKSYNMLNHCVIISRYWHIGLAYYSKSALQTTICLLIHE